MTEFYDAEAEKKVLDAEIEALEAEKEALEAEAREEIKKEVEDEIFDLFEDTVVLTLLFGAFMFWLCSGAISYFGFRFNSWSKWLFRFMSKI